MTQNLSAILPGGQLAARHSFAATARAVGRNTAGAGAGEEVTIEQMLNWVASCADGDMLYRTGGAWVRLPKGTATQMLRIGASTVLPTWEDRFWHSLTANTDFDDNPPSTSTVTMLVDHTGWIKVGMAIKYTAGGVEYYGVCTAIASNLMTIAGPPLTAADGNITALAVDIVRRPEILCSLISGPYADASDTDLMLNDMCSYLYWWGPPAYIVHYACRNYAGDTGATKDKIQVHNGGNDICSTAAGITVDDDAVYQTVVNIDPTNYLLTRGTSLISLASDGAGTNKNAVNLSYAITIVYQ